MNKACTRCGEQKPKEEFYKHAYASNGLQSHCKLCAKNIRIAYYAANKKNEIAKAQEWNAAHPERIRVSNAKYYAANVDKLKVRAAIWRAENIEASRVIHHNRRARKRGNGGELSKDISERLHKLQRGKCACCKRPLRSDFHRDHIMPLALGGTNTDDNIQLLCPPCNLQKHVKHPVDFMQQRGFLL